MYAGQPFVAGIQNDIGFIRPADRLLFSFGQS